MPGLSSFRSVLLASIALAAGCGLPETTEPVATRVSALTRTFAPTADTFINSAYPDNNNGTSDSIYTGRNGMTGAMRGLIRFAMPSELQDRVTVSAVRLTMTTRGLSLTGTSPPTAAVETLHAVATSWTEGSGVGDAMTQFTVGQACASAGSTGATWNQADCVTGAWTGGTVTAAASGSANVPAALDMAVVWDSAAGGDGMVADVQSWIDNPASNNGWRIDSSTEGATMSQAQKFYSRESTTNGPSLAVDYACKAGFSEVGGVCMDGSGGSGGAAGAGGGAIGSAGTTGGSGNSGCSCRISVHVGGTPVVELLIGFVILTGLRRRRRRP